jgi:diguanylate cyclase (GGDEF)-like protein
MARSGGFGKWLAGVACAIAAGCACAAEPEVAALAAPSDAATTAQVLAGARDAEFLPEPDGRVDVAGGAGRTWLRLRFALPEDGDPHADPQVLRFDRISLDRIAAYLPGRAEPVRDGFYFAEAAGSLGADSFAFAIPHHLRGVQTVYVAIETRARTTLTPRLLPAIEFHRSERRASALLGATYASILVLMLMSVALGLALRDRVHGQFVALTSGMLVLLLAVNGHLYRIAGLEALGWWGGYGVYALALVTSALALGFTRAFLGLASHAPRTARALAWLRVALLALAGLCLLDLRGFEDVLQPLAGTAVVVAAFANVGAAFSAWRRGESLARAYSLVWLMLGVAAALRIGMAHGWVPQHAVTLYGFQLAMAFGLFLMSVGLADRVMEFRKQRDRVRQQKEQADATLQQEQARRSFADGLRRQLLGSQEHGDVEWVAFRRLLATLRPMVPQRCSAVVATGYHGRDFSVVEPGDAAGRIATLMQARGARLRNLCLAHAPAHLAADERRAGDPDHDAPPVHYAVLPLPLSAPAWGALLLERDAAQPFADAELKLAADFLALAVAATDEAVRQHELRRQAEADPLTGACNRRAGDALLNSTLRTAIAAQQPYALLFVDLDHFKQVNDLHGHAAGDECLRAAAQAIRSSLGAGDVLVRYGGEEFLVIAPGRAPEASRELGETLRQAVLRLRVPNGAEPLRFTVSIGIAGRLPGETDPQDILERADKALYEAKRSGRNQVREAPTFGYGGPGSDLAYAPPPPLSL